MDQIMSKTQFRPKVETEPYNSKLTKYLFHHLPTRGSKITNSLYILYTNILIPIYCMKQWTIKAILIFYSWKKSLF